MPLLIQQVDCIIIIIRRRRRRNPEIYISKKLSLTD